jgi:hypothetical protein
MEAIRRKPAFGILAVLFTVLLFAGPILVVILGFREDGPFDRATGYEPLVVLVMTILLAFAAVGIGALGSALTGLVAVLRRERYPWLGWIGIVCGGFVLIRFLISSVVGWN